jgi:hypothetical protein
MRRALLIVVAVVTTSLGLATPALAATTSNTPAGVRAVGTFPMRPVNIVAAKLAARKPANATKVTVTVTVELPSSCYQSPSVTVTRVAGTTVYLSANGTYRTDMMCSQVVRSSTATVSVPANTAVIIDSTSGRKVRISH